MEPRMIMDLSWRRENFNLVVAKQNLWTSHKVDPRSPEGCGLNVKFDSDSPAVKWNPFQKRVIVTKDLTNYTMKLNGPFLKVEFSTWAFPEFGGMMDQSYQLAQPIKELVDMPYEDINSDRLESLSTRCLAKVGLGLNNPDHTFQFFGRGTDTTRWEHNLARGRLYMENIGTSCGSMDVSDDQYTSSASIKLVPDLWEQYIISEERNEGQPIIFKLASAATELVLKKAGLRTEASFLEDFKELNEEEQISVGQNMIKYSIMLKQLDMYIHGLCLVVFINCLYRRNMLDLTEEIELAVQSDMSLAGDLRKLVKTYLRCMYERDMEDYPL